MNEQSIDKSSFSIVSLLEAGKDETKYWSAVSPEERLGYMEELRRMNYGNAASSRLQRFFEVVERKQS
jgi:hypothetical protein